MPTENLNPLHDNYGVKLYDLSIDDLAERNEKAIFFDKMAKAANFLGMVPSHLYNKIGRGKYVTHKETGVKYTIRRVS